MTREAVIAEAMTWMGTPFRDQSDVKGAGVDCAMLLVRCFVDTGSLPQFDPRPYPPRWHLHQSEERFLGWIQKYGTETDRVERGNVIIFQEGRCFSHGALVLDEGRIIHSYYHNKRVIVTDLHDTHLNFLKSGKPRPRKIFDMWSAR